jgi:prepilin-type N-terminal cleavage/methylation domain-containing protein
MRAPHSSPDRPQHFNRANTTGSNRGFTLIEIMVVLGIVVIILGFTAPSVVGILRGKKVEQALSTVSDVLERTRVEAVTQNTYRWVGLANVTGSDSVSGQDELWILSFKGKSGESRITESGAILPFGPLRRVEGVSLVPQGKLPAAIKGLLPQESTDFADVASSSKPLKWAGSGSSGSKDFARLILFTPRGEALIETGDADLPAPQFYLWLGLCKTRSGEVPSGETDSAGLTVSGLTGRVNVVRP